MILNHIIKEAKMRSYSQLSLETGSMKAFKPSHKLYESFGFIPCPPFDNYNEDPYSLFFTKTL